MMRLAFDIGETRAHLFSTLAFRALWVDFLAFGSLSRRYPAWSSNILASPLTHVLFTQGCTYSSRFLVHWDRDHCNHSRVSVALCMGIYPSHGLSMQNNNWCGFCCLARFRYFYLLAWLIERPRTLKSRSQPPFEEWRFGSACSTFSVLSSLDFWSLQMTRVSISSHITLPPLRLWLQSRTRVSRHYLREFFQHCMRNALCWPLWYTLRIINAALLSSAWSAASSDMYSSSRALYGLSLAGNAPKIFSHTNSWGLPYASLAVSFVVGFLAYMSVGVGSAGQVFGWLSSWVISFHTPLTHFRDIDLIQTCVSDDRHD